MSSFSLLVIIVPHNRGEKITNAAVEAGAGGGTVLMGRSVSGSSLLAVLGFGETTKDIILMLVSNSQKKIIIDSIIQKSMFERMCFGQMFSIEADFMLKTGTISGGERSMHTEKEHDIICVILNKGYADDAMAAARRAGAGGGTIINARGTANENDAQFFGMHIIPEKEMLVIIVDHVCLNSVLESIRVLKCLSEPGSGIAFCSGIDDFTILGKNNA